MDLLLSGGGGHVGSGMYLPSSAPPPVQPSVPELVKPSRQGPSAEYTLGPGDVLRITIYGHGDLPQEVVISADGLFIYSFIGQVRAAGLTVPQLTESMVRRLEEGYLVAPQMTIAVTQYSSQQVDVLGRCNLPASTRSNIIRRFWSSFRQQGSRPQRLGERSFSHEHSRMMRQVAIPSPNSKKGQKQGLGEVSSH